MPSPTPSSDAELAEEVAASAGRLLLGLRAEPGELKGRALGEAGDAAAHNKIISALRAARPADAILSEEAADDPTRLGVERVWVVDPLDGTREFGEKGRVDWAVHVALTVRGCLACGAVALPALGTVLMSARSTVLTPREGPMLVAASRSRAPQVVFDVAAGLPAEVVLMGSAGAKTAAVITGEADAYIHAGGQWEWDVAAPAAVALASGLHVSRLDGSPLEFNQATPWSPDLLVCRPDLAARILELAAVRDGTAADDTHAAYGRAAEQECSAGGWHGESGRCTRR